MKPIYKPAGRAGEYGDYAINIYTGCPHRCYYCFAPLVLRKDRETFHSCVVPRPGIVEATKRQIDKEGITSKLIHLCFTCDPYPMGYDTTPTREIIKAIKDSGNRVQILTKNGADAERDFDLLDGNDLFGVSLTGYQETCLKAEPRAGTALERMIALFHAVDAGIKTWISFEPVLDADYVQNMIPCASFAKKIKIGKLNHYPSNINWHDFGHEVEGLCKKLGRDYYIKNDLRKEMEAP